MKGQISIDIQIPVYLVKFIQIKYGTSPLPVSKKNGFGLLILNLLESKKSSIDYREFMMRRNATFQVLLGKKYYNAGKVVLSETKNRQLVQNLDELFNQVVFNEVYHSVEDYKVGPATEVIADIMERFGIVEEDISFDSLLKRYKRWKKDYEDRLYSA